MQSLSVNEIFDPECVDTFYDLPPETQSQTLSDDKSTNYSVVRSELLDQLYERMYHQRLQEPDPSKWRCKIRTSHHILKYDKQSDGRLRLRLKNTLNGEITVSESAYDLVLVGTGYERNLHQTLLEPTRYLTPSNRFTVERNYQVRFREGAVAEDAGIWLQGCCEDSHGVSLLHLQAEETYPNCII